MATTYDFRSVQGVLQRLAGLEGGNLGSLDLDGGTGARVAAGARGALAHHERAEAHQGNVVAFLQRLADDVGDGIESPTGIGLVSWDDIEGVQATDASGQPLKELIDDAIPPGLVGLIATSQASLRQSTQGQGKIRWSVYEAGSVNACRPGKLSVAYDGETYVFETPMPGCPPEPAKQN